MNSTLNTVPKQLDFTSIQDPRPVPLIVSEKWNFPLRYHIINGICYFSVIDWIAGIGTSDEFRASDTWRKLQKTLRISNPDGVPADFATDISLYDIAQNMRVTKERPALKAIQDYLSQAGSLLDQWRRNPKKMLSVAMARMQADIDRHEKAGLGDRPEIIHLKSEFEVRQSLKALNELLKKLVNDPKYGAIHNAKYAALFNAKAEQIQEILGSKDIMKALPLLQLNTLDYAHKQIIAVLSMQKNLDTQRVLDAIHIVVEPLGEYLKNVCNLLGIHPITGQPLLEKANQ